MEASDPTSSSAAIGTLWWVDRRVLLHLHVQTGSHAAEAANRAYNSTVVTFFRPDKPLRRLWAALNAAGLWTVAMLILWLLPSPCIMGHWREQLYGFFGPYFAWRPGPQWTDLFTGEFGVDLNPVSFGVTVAATVLVTRMLWLRYIFLVTGKRRPFLVVALQGTRRRLRGCCPGCGYDLRHKLNDGCPECGWLRSG